MRTMALNKPSLIFGLVLLASFFTDVSYGQSSTLRIAPGDTVTIHVYDTPEMEQIVRVSQSGDVDLLLIGTVHIGGLTPADAGQLVESLLISKQIMKAPSLTVTVTSYETEIVAVGGEVKLPGPQQITASRSAIDLIALSGGLTEFADRRNIVVRRKGSKDNFTKFYFSNDPAEALQNDVPVEPGDTIVVPRVGVVYVLGDVGRPGGFTMSQPDSSMTVLRAIGLAAGTNHSATPSNSKLVRRTAEGGVLERKLNISRMQKGEEVDVPLLAGDVIYVPFSYIKNALAIGSGGLITTAAQAAIYSH